MMVVRYNPSILLSTMTILHIAPVINECLFHERHTVSATVPSLHTGVWWCMVVEHVTPDQVEVALHVRIIR